MLSIFVKNWIHDKFENDYIYNYYDIITTIVVHNTVGVGVDHKVNSLKNCSQFSQIIMGSIGHIKLSPNKLSDQVPKSCHGNLKKNYLMDFLLTD